MASNYDKDMLNDICSNIDLLEYASKSMEFKKCGTDSYATHCCLHIDKTPSLYITPSKNLFHCFSCGKSGNVLNWLMTFEHMSFNDAISKMSEMSGVDIKHLKQCSALKIYKDMYRNFGSKKESRITNRKILEQSEIEKYSDEIPEEWVKEGISPEIMKKHNIRIDEKSNRIVYPIYDNDLNLIGFKGRTRFENYKEMRIAKYQNYQKIGTTDFFVGMKENYQNIKDKNEAIIFEGIKSGLKAEEWGYNYWLSSETSWLNDEQVLILIKMQLNKIVIAYDNDVPIQKIKECTAKLRKFSNVYVVRDRPAARNKLLGSADDKMSPVDKGEEIWNILYEEKRRI